MQLNPDFVVIGAGIAGASAAYELSAHGKVVVLEAEAVAGYHTTGRSAALFTEAWERGPWRALASSSRPFLETPPAGFVEHPILSSLPVLIIGRIDQSDAVQSLYETATAQVAVTLLDGDEASNWCPMLRPGYVHKALLESRSHAIDVDGLHQGFQRGAKRRGGQIMLGHTVDRIERRGPGWLVVAGDVEVQTPVVVNAAGAWCDKVGAMAGLPPIGLVPKRRTAFTFAAPDGVDLGSLAMVIDIDEQFYFKPESGQLMGSLAEATPMEPHDVRPEEIDVALAIERIEAATVMEIRHVRRTWAGLRSFVADGSPVVGEDPLAPGFFWLAGQGGAGILTSPAMSQLVAGLVTTGAAPAALFDHGVDEQSLSPTRLCGRS